MNRVELLTKVKEQVQEKGTIRYLYVNGEGCMCAVGYILSECGINMDDIREDEEINNYPITRVADRERDIFDSIVAAGLTVGNLNKLQSANDSVGDSTERKQAVIEVIDELLEDFTEADKEITL